MLFLHKKDKVSQTFWPGLYVLATFLQVQDIIEEEYYYLGYYLGSENIILRNLTFYATTHQRFN